MRDREEEPERDGQAPPVEVVVHREPHGMPAADSASGRDRRPAPWCIYDRSPGKHDRTGVCSAVRASRSTSPRRRGAPTRGARGRADPGRGRARDAADAGRGGRADADQRARPPQRQAPPRDRARQPRRPAQGAGGTSRTSTRSTRMEINDHSWVHIQIVTNIALKLLRQLTKHGDRAGGGHRLRHDPRRRRGRRRAHRAHPLRRHVRCTATGTRTSASSSPSRSCASSSTGSTTSPTGR